LANRRLDLPTLWIEVTLVWLSRADLIGTPPVARLADDAGVVAATCQHEGALVRGDEMELVDRVPGSNVIGDSSDGKARQPNVTE
jgi:hypothetical protein